jgi:PHD/YefM family antitoxin component YafN of YafNO toxin-antitoxin module
MKRKKRKKIVLLTPEEWAAQEERLESLLRQIERAKIEMETGKRPPPEPSQAKS